MCQMLTAWSSEVPLGADELTCGPKPLLRLQMPDCCTGIHKFQNHRRSPVSLEMTCAASAFSVAEIMGLGRRCTLRMSSRPWRSGRGTTTLRERRPGRVRAESSTCRTATEAAKGVTQASGGSAASAEHQQHTVTLR